VVDMNFIIGAIFGAALVLVTMYWIKKGKV